MLNLIFAACSKQLDDESSWLKMSVHWFIRNQILARMRHETSRHQSIIPPCLISPSQQKIKRNTNNGFLPFNSNFLDFNTVTRSSHNIYLMLPPTEGKSNDTVYILNVVGSFAEIQVLQRYLGTPERSWIYRLCEVRLMDWVAASIDLAAHIKPPRLTSSSTVASQLPTFSLHY